MKWTPLVLGALALGCAMPAMAAPPPVVSASVGVCDFNSPTHCLKPDASGNTPMAAFSPVGLANVSVTAVTAASALPTASTNLWLINTGTTAVYYNLGTSNAVTATTGSSYLAGGACTLLVQGANTYIAAITASGTGTLQVQTGTGTPLGCGGGGGGASAATQTGINVTVTPTIQNAQYVSGNCMGGFQTVALGASASVLSQTALSSKGGLATGKVIYEFFANPAGSTCTDKGAFTLAAADVSKLMGVFTLTPAASTGTTVSQAAQQNQALGVPSGGNIYLAVVETATETPATTTDLVVILSGY